MLLDAHIHLQDIQDEKVRAAILAQTQEPKTGRFFCNGIRPEDWSMVSQLARRDGRMVPFFGVHPWYADKVWPGWEAELERFLQEQPLAGIGEIGLDKSKETIDFTKQADVFLKQLKIAERLSWPVVVHCVRAWGDLFTLLRDCNASHVRLMIHAFYGSPEILSDLLAIGSYISFSWKRIRDQKDDIMGLIRRVPLERLLLETDFPSMEPGAIVMVPSVERYFQCLHETYTIAARAKGITEKQLQEAVWKNGATFLHRTPAR